MDGGRSPILEWIHSDATSFMLHPEIRELLEERIEEALRRLTPREEKVIRLLFGVGGDRPCAVTEVAKECCISPNDVRRIEAGALTKLFKLDRINRIKG